MVLYSFALTGALLVRRAPILFFFVFLDAPETDPSHAHSGFALLAEAVLTTTTTRLLLTSARRARIEAEIDVGARIGPHGVDIGEAHLLLTAGLRRRRPELAGIKFAQRGSLRFDIVG